MDIVIKATWKEAKHFGLRRHKKKARILIYHRFSAVLFFGSIFFFQEQQKKPTRMCIEYFCQVEIFEILLLVSVFIENSNLSPRKICSVLLASYKISI